MSFLEELSKNIEDLQVSNSDLYRILEYDRSDIVSCSPLFQMSISTARNRLKKNRELLLGLFKQKEELESMSGSILFDENGVMVKFKPNSQLYPYVRVSIEDDDEAEFAELDELDRFIYSLQTARECLAKELENHPGFSTRSFDLPLFVTYDEQGRGVVNFHRFEQQIMVAVYENNKEFRLIYKGESPVGPVELDELMTLSAGHWMLVPSLSDKRTHVSYTDELGQVLFAPHPDNDTPERQEKFPCMRALRVA